MPGLFGFYRNTLQNSEATRIGEQMRTLLTHKRSYVCDDIFIDDHICAGRSHPNVIQKEKQPYNSNNSVYVWLDGEFYDVEGHPEKNIAHKKTDPAILAEMFVENRRKNPDWDFLKNIDGAYTAVIWDKDNKKIHLISDRYSSIILYWTLVDGIFIWGTELKIFPTHPKFSIKIDQEAIDEFINLGIIVENNTYFKNVERIPAASVITFDITNSTISKHRYWWWNEVPLLGTNVPPEDMCEELGNRFIKSVADRVHGDCKIELSLSGGVDSRAILAALPDTDPPVSAYTFGRPESEDVIVAKKYARMKGIPHTITHIHVDNWLQERIKCIWWIDGMADVQNMHGASVDAGNDNPGTIALVGLFAEVLKGLYWHIDLNDIDNFIAAKQAAGYMYKNVNVLEKYSGYIRSLGSSHIFTMDMYIKNFTAFGRRLGVIDGTEIRVPFSANSLLEYVYSIPPHMLKTPDIYHAMLVLKFPRYFRGIQYRNINIPTDNYHKVVFNYNRVRYGLLRRAIRYGLYKPKSNYLASYPEWLREGIGKISFDKILNNRSALYKDYIKDISVSKHFDDHIAGKNYTNLLTRVFTIEIWLQQLINSKYRTNLDDK